MTLLSKLKREKPIAPAALEPRASDGSALSLQPEKHHGEYDTTPLPRVTWASLTMGVVVSMGGFIFGYDTGQISGFLAMDDFLLRFGQLNPQTQALYFSNVRSGLIVALLSVGTLFGALVAAPIADRIGRKRSITFWCIEFMLGMIIQIASAHNWKQVAGGRFVAGWGVGALSLLVPMYQAETAPRHIRGALISTYQLFITLGIFMASCINFSTEKRQNSGSWRVPMGVSFLWALILAIGILFLPESPRHAYRKGRIDEAKTTMERIYGVSDNHYEVLHELEEIKEKERLESEGGEHGFFQEIVYMFKAPKMAYRILLGVTLQMMQQLTGANYFFYYGTVIFKSTGINNSYVTQMILNGINFGTTFGGLYLIEHYGRRRSLIAGAIWMFMCFMVFASVGHFSLDHANPANTPHAGKAMIIFAALFIAGFAMTWGPMVWTIIGELYPSRYRAKAMALATASNWLWNFLIAFFTPFIVGDIDYLYGYVFAGCLVLAAALVYFFVMEGKGRTLEEIDTMYLLGVKPWKSSGWIAPRLEELQEGSGRNGNGEVEKDQEDVHREL